MRTLAARIIGDRTRHGVVRQLLVSGVAATTVVLMSSSVPAARVGGASPAPAGASFGVGTLAMNRPIHLPAISVRQAVVQHSKATPKLPPSAFSHLDIPATAFLAYQRAAAVIGQADPSCGLSWPLLAAIGRVESDHGRFGGAQLLPDGTSSPAIRGVALDGTGPVARVPDTDGGRLDGDPVWDRAVGPMQFLPSTWAVVGVDANGDSVRSPDNINDAALAAAVFLCGAPGDLTTRSGRATAVYRYNPSASYVASVLALERSYRANEPSLLGSLALGGSVQALPLVTVRVVQHHQAPSGGAARGSHGTARADGTRGTGAAAGHTAQAQGLLAGPPAGQGPGAPHTTGTDPTGTPGPGAAGTPDPGASAPPDPGATASPDPTPDPTPSPTPAPDPSPSPTPAPDPSPTPAPPTPDPVQLTGVLTACGTGWCLDQQPLDVGDPAFVASPALADFDADGVVESNHDELTGLAGTEVSVLATPGTAPARVLALNGLAYVVG